MTLQPEQPRLERVLGSTELWSLAGATVVMPRFNRRWSNRLRGAWWQRLWGELRGRCGCGGEGKPIVHLGRCLAAGERLLPMIEAEDRR